MFGLLKKKITSFIDQLTQKEEQKGEPEQPPKPLPQPETPAEPLKPPAAPPTIEPQKQEPQPATPPQREPATPPKEPRERVESRTPTIPPAPEKPPTQSKPTIQPTEPVKPKPEPQEPATKPKTILSPQTPHFQTPEPVNQEPRKAVPSASVPPEKKVEPATTIREQPTPTPTAQKKVQAEPQKPKPGTTPPAPPQKIQVQTSPDEPKKERKLEAKLGLFSKVKGFFVKEVQIQETELEPMLEELQLALLESDVTLDTADHIISNLKTQLSGKKVEKQRVQEEIKHAVHATLTQLVDQEPLDIVAFIHSQEKPVKILFLGPNGAGKTTTIAKTAFFLKQHGVSVVLAAGDTFRAAAIEQIQHHGEKIGVNVIAHQYGSDPSAVAFDAIAHAKAKHLDAVLIDTAGRQETNHNLLKEMEKINRVVKPDLKLFVGEAVAGHSLVEQAKKFHESLNIDGVILTKVDCDAKGGTSFSVAHEVGVPIALIGVGQEYGDLKPFDPNWLVSNVLAE